MMSRIRSFARSLWPVFFSKGSRLSKRLLLYIVLCSSFFTLLTTSFQLYMDYKRDVSAIHESLEFIEAGYRDPLAATAYNMDYDQLKLLLKGVLKFRDIAYLEISEPLCDGRKTLVQEGDAEAGQDIVREVTLEYPAAPESAAQYATLHISASLKGVYERLWDKVLVVLGSNAVKTFMASLFIFLIIQYVITRHLVTVARYTRGFRLNRQAQSLELQHKRVGSAHPDELDQLTAAINEMRERLIRDNENRKKAEATLRAGKAFTEKLIHSMPDGFSLLDKNGIHVDVNPALCKMTGFRKEELVGVGPPHPYWPEEERAAIEETFQKTLGGHFDQYELRFRRKNGERFPVIISPAALRDPEGQISHYFATIKDISERKHYEEALRDQLHMLQELMDRIPTPIFYKDVDGIYQGCNKAFEALTGKSREEIIGKQTHDVFPPALADAYVQQDREVLEDTTPRSYESSPPARDGTARHVIFNKAAFRKADGDIGGIVGVIFDITDRKALEGQLVEAQKMEAIGTLAGGVAHDFNNILSAILGFTELALGEPDRPRDKIRSDLEQVHQAGTRARDLVRRILTVSRHHDQERIPLQPSHLVKEALKLIRATLPAFIDIRENVAKDTGVVEADPNQLHQVLMNLCTNAAQAMGHGTGVLTVTLENVDMDAARAGAYLNLEPGPYVRLSVADTGCGIPARILERIFDPYFTTKQRGEGTGLGLSVVKGIVERHGGDMSVKSEPGKGTVFHVYLPRIPERATETPDRQAPAPRGTERILLVDDEPPLVDIGKRMLENLGYEVETCTRSLQALALFQDDPKRFDLVVTDLTMPELTGLDLAKEMLEIRPDLPVILCTGHSTQTERERARAAGIRGFLGKPLISRDLGMKVREVLDG